MSSVTKDVLYIDVDDEITTLIDRLTASDHKLVALVLPKRATVLQSIVNMRLLKRAADENKKHVVLVTTEQGLMPLAGAVGLHVAATPNSKPAIPHKPAGMKHADGDEADLTEEDFDPRASAAASVGALADDTDNEETIQLDNEDKEPAAGAAVSGKAAKKAAKPKKGKNKKLKVPDFNAFRKKWLIIGGAVAALLILWIFAFMVLPKATIAIKTDSEDIEKTLDVTFDTNASGVNDEDDVVPSVVEQTQKVTTQSASASGQENRGSKATGEVTFTVDDFQACAPGRSVVIPAGTGVSRNNLTYITQDSVRLGRQGGSCQLEGSSDITAQAPGANYNVSKGKFSVSGTNGVSASGSAEGGTDNIVKFVTQSDIDSAKQKVSSQVDNAVQDDLAGKLEDRGLYAIRESFNTGTPEVTVSAKVGDQVDSVSATQKTTYSMVGVKKKDLEQFITSKVHDDIDTGKQRVLNTGLDDAVFKLQNQQNNSAQVLMSMNLTALAGPKLDDDKIKGIVAGKKAGEIRDTLNNYPGVTDVEVKTSPFWVNSVPKSASKITITYEK
jgi:hypothetical protein